MPTLRIEYESKSRSALITYTETDSAWGLISQAFSSYTEHLQIISPTALKMPWWALLAARAEVALYVQQFGIDLDADPQASKLLSAANERQNAYETSSTVERLPEQSIIESLQNIGFERLLTPEQLRNISKVAALNSAATFSVPGAGKTTEGLALYFLKRKPKTRLLVVAPKNAFAAWQTELELCVPKTTLEFVRLTGGNENIKSLLALRPTLMLITYHQLQISNNLVGSYISEESSFLYLDESHRIKAGPPRPIANAALALCHIPDFKLILTGTPMPNSESDLVPQFSFLYPEVDIEDRLVTDMIGSVYVRTTKAELKLPPLRRRIAEIPMSPAQAALYELLRSEAARQANELLGAHDRVKLRALGSSVIRLLQTASNPSLLSKSETVDGELLADALAEGDSPKLQFACLRARQLARKKQKTVIWSTFVDNVESITSRLSDIGADFIHGGVDAGNEDEENTREGKIKRFHQDPEAMVLVANPAACGEGISLHKVCHYAIYVDRNYNAGQYLQSEDRIHRLGLDAAQVTHVEILCSPNTVDSSVDRRLRHKVSNMARVLNDPQLNIDPVSFDPAAIDDDEGMDSQDIRDFIGHLRNSP